MHFEFRAPAVALPLHVLLQRAFPGASAADAEAWVERGAVRVGARARPGPATRVSPGSLLRVAADSGTGAEAALALPGAGPLLVLTPKLPWQSGSFEATRRLPGGLRFERRACRDGLCELRIEQDTPAPGRALEHLARLGFAVIGDLRNGGVLVEGGLRARAADAPEPDGWWPDEPVLLGADSRQSDALDPPPFHVSKATERALNRGHPWVLRDGDTDDAARFAAGSLVRLGAGVVARVEDGGHVAARVWSRGAKRGSQSVEERVARALARRAGLLHPPAGTAQTDALRLIHGEADALPGLAVDRLGPLLRMLVTGRAADALVSRVRAALIASLGDVLGGDPPVVEVIHLRDRPPGRFECVRLARGDRGRWSPLFEASESGVLEVVERGLCFGVDPGLARPERPGPGFGLYLDQRDNRERLARRARGGRWLNLFAHTGAFSLALLAGGADQVVSVDLSARVLRWLEANLARNAKLDATRHQSACADGRRYLEGHAGGPDFDGIVIDPPTAAAGGRGFWKLERDLPPLVGSALARLTPGGTLFVSRNDRRRRESAVEIVRRVAHESGVALRSVEPAPPGVDFPRLEGFAEGDPFDAAIAVRR